LPCAGEVQLPQEKDNSHVLVTAHSSPPPQVPLPSGMHWRLKCGVLSSFWLVISSSCLWSPSWFLLSFLCEEVVILQQFQEKEWDAEGVVFGLNGLKVGWPGAEGSRGEPPKKAYCYSSIVPPQPLSSSGSYRDKPELGSDQPKPLLRPREQSPCD